jgi:glycosyltransferase involved in cell wall biosynthesis
MAEFFGLGILVDAFMILKKERHHKDLKLRITGGFTADDAKFVKSIHKKLKKEKVIKDVDFLSDFSPHKRKEFLQSLSMLSVPVLEGEALGTYLIEALAAGVPVVQPAEGGFAELIKITDGGILFHPNDSYHLANGLELLLLDKNHARQLAENGRKVIFEKFDIKHMAEKIVDIYETVVKK